MRAARSAAARSRPLAASVLLVVAAVPAAVAQEGWVAVRAVDHGGHSRIVFDSRTAPAYVLEQQGDRAILRFSPPVPLDLSEVSRPPRNVLGVAATAGGVEIALRPGARVRHRLIGSKVVVDVLDAARTDRAPPNAEAAAPAAEAPPGPAPVRPSSSPPSRAATQMHLPSGRQVPGGRSPGHSSAPSTDAGPPAGVVVVPVQPTPPDAAPASAAPSGSSGPGQEVPARLAAGALAPDARGAPPASAMNATSLPAPGLPVRLIATGGRGKALLLPFGQEVGLAVLRRGDAALAVLDVPRPLELSSLRSDPVFAAAEARVLAGGGTQLTLTLPPPATLRARRLDGAWVLDVWRPERDGDGAPVPPADAADRPLAPGSAAGDSREISLRASRPGRVVAMADPETGLPLLVGTVRDPGQAVPQHRRLPQADLLATGLGAAVLARADHIALRSVPDGFLLSTAGGARLAFDAAATASPGGAAAVTAMTRLFEFADLPAERLSERLRAEHAAIAVAPPLARAGLRRAAAETLLSLRLPQEPQAMLGLGAAENPAAAADPLAAALSGAAALLSGRPAEAAALDHTPLPERDEVILWHALLAAHRGEAGAAADGLAATFPLALAYPEGLRARLLPRIANSLAAAGAWDALRRLVAAAGTRPDLALAGAMLAEAEGRADEALAGYDAVAQGRDRLARARAISQAVELRLASGRMDARQAAQANEAALFAWRGDERELAARRRLAELQSPAGDARRALALLRETEVLFPEQSAALRPAIQLAFLSALRQEAPVGAVAVFDADPGLLPSDAAGEEAAILLADRLSALDLTERAASLLRRAAERATGAGRAALGLRLAQLRLAEGDAAGALAALDGTAAAPAEGLPATLARDRAVLAARAEARQGRVPQAVAALLPLGPTAAEPLAEILAEAQHWAGAAAAMAVHLRTAVPPAPATLEEAQRRALLRQATLLALAGDTASLAALGAEFAPRLAGGPLAELFVALTADPPRSLADLPRLRRELQLFRSFPARLEPLRAAGLATR